MRKGIIVLLLILIVLPLFGCQKENHKEDPIYEITGIVEEVNSESVLIRAGKVIELGFPSGSLWEIPLKTEETDSYTDALVGDEIIVVFKGDVLENDILQVNQVLRITLKTPAVVQPNNPVDDDREVLHLIDFRNHPVGLYYENDNLIKMKSVNIEHKKLDEKDGLTFDYDPAFETLSNYVKEEFGIELDAKWMVFIHYYNSDKTNGVVEFQYTIGPINTNRSITFNIDGDKYTSVSYKCLDAYEDINEDELVNRVKLFEEKYVQERKELSEGESFFEEHTDYTYYYNEDKLIYSYAFFYKTTAGYISNDWGTLCVIKTDGSVTILH